MRAWSCAAVVAVAAACGGGGGGGGDDEQPDAGDGSSDSGTEPGWTTLIERNWSLGTVQEGYKCVSLKVTEDMYIGAFRAKAPTGTHHSLLTTSATPFTMPGNYDCDATANSMQMLYGGGIGTQAFALPTGVAIKLPKDTYINLNLHVANRSDDPISGTSGIEVKLVPANEVVHEADMIFLGTFGIHIPPDSQQHVEPAMCSAPTTWNIVNMWPHMHGYATHQRVWVVRDGGATMNLIDADYSQVEQKNYPMTVKVNTNDQLWVECRYVNTTNVTHPPGFMITYGESATQEMCFTGMYKYPKGGTMYGCVEPDTGP
jgi:hypothetical protein